MFKNWLRIEILTFLFCYADVVIAYEAGVRHSEGKGLGYSQGYTTLEVFKNIGPICDDYFPFGDLRGHVFNDGRWAANAGLGVRKSVCDRIYGANIYYDYRNTYRKTFSQIGFGVEALNECWEARVNVYFSVGDKKSHPFDCRFNHFEGHRLWIRRACEMAKNGFDAEVAMNVACYDNLRLSVAAGPYFYYGHDGKNLVGGKARIDVALGRYLSLEFIGTCDNVFHTRAQGQIALYIPFGPCCEPACDAEILTQPVYRNEIIVVQKHHDKHVAKNPKTGKPYTFWFVDNTSHSEGTIESPFPTLVDAQNASAPGDVIYVFPGNGTATGMDTGITLQDNQLFFGASTPQGLLTTDGPIVIPSQTTVLPSITNGGGDVITLANHNAVSGFFISNPNGNGITSPASPITDVAILNNVIVGNGGSGINLNNVSGFSAIVNNQLITMTFPSLAITATNISNSTYHIKDNLMTTLLECINESLTDCVGIHTIIKGNSLNANRSAFVFTTTNTVAPSAPNEFTLSDNEITCRFFPITITPSGFANSLGTIKNNKMSSVQSGNILTSHDNSTTTLDIANNSFSISSNAFGCSLQNESILNINFENNDVQSALSSAFGCFPQDNSQINCTIINNRIATSSINVAIDIVASVNAIGNFNISKNRIKSATDGINLTGVDNSQLTASLEHNTIHSTTSAGIILNTSFASQGKWHVNGNTIVGTMAEAVRVLSNQTSSTCLSFTNNTATPFQGAYQFNQNDSSTFNLEPLFGNIGSFGGNATTPNVPKGACN